MYTAIVKIGDYSIASVYEGSTKTYSGPWGDSNQFEHVEFNEVTVGSSMQPALTAADNAGTTEISLNIQPQRNAKLATLRGLRDNKNPLADNNIRMHDDNDANKVGTLTDWQTYRTNLRNITNSYKDTDPMVGTSGLDAFAEDMSDFSGWPTEPS